VILRVLRGRVQPHRVAELRGRAGRVLEDARRRDGCTYAQIGRQVHGDGSEEVLFVSLWRDLESLYGWVGGTDLLRTPVLSGAGPDLFDSHEVQHYEVWEAFELGDRGSPVAAATQRSDRR
jgi:hypothetical protein